MNLKTLTPRLAAISLGLTACTTKTYHSDLTEGMDTSIAPQQDFYG